MGKEFKLTALKNLESIETIFKSLKINETILIEQFKILVVTFINSNIIITINISNNEIIGKLYKIL